MGALQSSDCFRVSQLELTVVTGPSSDAASASCPGGTREETTTMEANESDGGGQGVGSGFPFNHIYTQGIPTT